MGWEKFQIFWELLNWEDVRLKLFAIRSHSTFHFSTKGVSLFIGVRYLLKKWIQVGFFFKELELPSFIFSLHVNAAGGTKDRRIKGIVNCFCFNKKKVHHIA